MNYRNFKVGDLVQIDHGSKPLGIVIGEPRLSKNKHIKTGEYPINIYDIDEVYKEIKWYHTFSWSFDSLGESVYGCGPILPVYIHPEYLIFLSEA